MKYAVITEDGFIKAFYDEEIYKSNIPENAIPILEEKWREIIESGRKYIYKNGEFIPYEKPAAIKFEESKVNLLNNIQNIADTKSKEAKNYIVGKKLTDEQINRYELKYQTALKCKESGDYTPLQLEAELQGITGEELANLIIQAHDEWIAALEKFSGLIEAYRVKAQSIVNNLSTIEQIELAKTYLLKAKEMGVDTTEEDIKRLFKEFENELEALNNA